MDKVLVEGDVIGGPEVESGAAVGVDDVIVVDDVDGGIDVELAIGLVLRSNGPGCGVVYTF